MNTKKNTCCAFNLMMHNVTVLIRLMKNLLFLILFVVFVESALEVDRPGMCLLCEWNRCDKVYRVVCVKSYRVIYCCGTFVLVCKGYVHLLLTFMASWVTTVLCFH